MVALSVGYLCFVASILVQLTDAGQAVARGLPIIALLSVIPAVRAVH